MLTDVQGSADFHSVGSTTANTHLWVFRADVGMDGEP